MNNRRLGQLLQEHFPDSKITGQPGLWQIELPADVEPSEPTLDQPDVDSQQASPSEPKDEDAESPEADPTESMPDVGQRLPPVLLVMTDQRADRMRIMIPIRSFNTQRVDDLQLALIALHANYDRALDARYAIQDGVLWSAFIHPLSSLTRRDLASALAQVQTLRINTGSSYSSGALIFGPGLEQEGSNPEDNGDEMPTPRNPEDQTA